MTEFWDVYDENRNKMGRTHVRGAPVAPGDYHLVVGAIVLNCENQVLCTRRSPEKPIFPGRWECTQGSVTAGEDSLTGIRRELREETGLDFSPGQLTLLYQAARKEQGMLLDLYAARTDRPISSLTFQEGETDGAAWVPLEEWERRMRREELVFPVDHGDEAFYTAVRRFAGTEPGSLCIRWPLDDSSATLQRQIQTLEETAWPGCLDGVWPEPEHLASFCRLEHGVLAAHAAVVGKRIQHRGKVYFACGLAEVVTHPSFRGRGLALELIRRAAAFIRSQEADLSAFTCRPELAAFYRQGGWEERPDLCLIGGTREKPFPSDGEGLSVLFQLLSEEARAHAEDFRNTCLFLDLGEGRLW